MTPLSYHFLLLSGGQDTFGKWYYCTTGISQHTTDISPRFDQDLTSFNLLWDQIADLLDVIISRWTAVFTMLTAAASLTTTTLIEQLCNQQSLFRQLQTPGTCMYWFWCGIYMNIYIYMYIYNVAICIYTYTWYMHVQQDKIMIHDVYRIYIRLHVYGWPMAPALDPRGSKPKGPAFRLADPGNFQGQVIG